MALVLSENERKTLFTKDLHDRRKPRLLQVMPVLGTAGEPFSVLKAKTREGEGRGKGTLIISTILPRYTM
jgi:hypothetical protein